MDEVAFAAAVAVAAAADSSADATAVAETVKSSSYCFAGVPAVDGIAASCTRVVEEVASWMVVPRCDEDEVQLPSRPRKSCSCHCRLNPGGCEGSGYSGDRLCVGHLHRRYCCDQWNPHRRVDDGKRSVAAQGAAPRMAALVLVLVPQIDTTIPILPQSYRYSD